MKNQHSELSELGWSDWFAEKAEDQSADTIARVIAVDRGQLLLMDQARTFRAKLSGGYQHRHRLAHESPCVGDWVCLEKPAEGGMGVVQTLLERRTSLRRKSAGNEIDHQMIAANMDYVVIIQSCHLDFDLKRLERYLVMAQEGGAEPFILLTKTDLVEPDVLAAQMAEIRAAGIAAPVVAVSNVTRAGVDDFQRQLLAGKTYCFVGSSGVGKSTLINLLLGHELQFTMEVSETGEGRHSTVRRELIRLAGGALVIDNPGMREVGVFSAEADIGHSYPDIEALSAGCRFSDCSHTGEPGCAVREAAQSGEISQAHFENYLKLKEESAFNQLSYVEKRRKDRSFGKYIKSAKNDLKQDTRVSGGSQQQHV